MGYNSLARAYAHRSTMEWRTCPGSWSSPITSTSWVQKEPSDTHFSFLEGVALSILCFSEFSEILLLLNAGESGFSENWVLHSVKTLPGWREGPTYELESTSC